MDTILNRMRKAGTRCRPYVCAGLPSSLVLSLMLMHARGLCLAGLGLGFLEEAGQEHLNALFGSVHALR